MITKDMILEDLRQLVAEVGTEFRYSPPPFESEDTPYCRYADYCPLSSAVGRVLFNRGVPVEVLAKMDDVKVGVFSSITNGEVRQLAEDALGSPLADDAAEALRMFQYCQDTQRTYGLALQRAALPFDL